ncbi:hypothetical protein Sango_3042800 [Sesamum angolense]|uniref:Uncharacterized protein n=1 Tax=Sesamum angolense TaxID=2727404 RepID=A0AAE1TAZ0_9LAMI|nr:hypothetical protein Sango_3042800 [Sesamum angolense]
MLRQRAKLQWLKGGDQCSKVFFRRVATRRGNKRLFQISDSDGLVQTDPNIISSIFVSYFQDLLGGDRAERALDLHYLRPWARHILTEEEAYALIRPVTVDDVKTAMFDIEEDKAPGPDGFSSGFYKAAWPILGEISKAIMDFFTTGRLLKQVNATVLTLIPKCRLPPRCALKVNLRKAYDIVEWDFLFATLRLFGFPAVFIRWIEECVTSAHYSMILQQFIDQDGQFLYHWRCTELKLFQLSFADDLLLLCKADVQSTLGFQEGHLPVRYLGLPLISAWLSIADWQPLLQKIDSRIKGWEGVQLSFAGRVQLIKSVLVPWRFTGYGIYFAKGIIKEMIKQLRTFLWKGTSSSGYPKWLGRLFADQSRKGEGIKDIFALNRADEQTSVGSHQAGSDIYLGGLDLQVRLRDCSIWTAKDNKGAWGWRKMLTLRHTLLSHIHFRVGDGTSFSLWHDPWHTLGPLITQFPRGPQMTNTGTLDKLSVVMKDGQWNWPMITDIAFWK